MSPDGLSRAKSLFFSESESFVSTRDIAELRFVRRFRQTWGRDYQARGDLQPKLNIWWRLEVAVRSVVYAIWTDVNAADGSDVAYPITADRWRKGWKRNRPPRRFSVWHDDGFASCGIFVSVKHELWVCAVMRSDPRPRKTSLLCNWGKNFAGWELKRSLIFQCSRSQPIFNSPPLSTAIFESTPNTFYPVKYSRAWQNG